MSNHREETIHRLAIEGWTLPAIQKLLRAAKKAQRAATMECNGPPDNHFRDEHSMRAWVDWLAKYSGQASRAVELACKGQPHLGYRIDGDPRGYVVKLMLKSGAYNTFGGKETGWGIPA